MGFNSWVYNRNMKLLLLCLCAVICTAYAFPRPQQRERPQEIKRFAQGPGQYAGEGSYLNRRKRYYDYQDYSSETQGGGNHGALSIEAYRQRLYDETQKKYGPELKRLLAQQAQQG